MQYSKQGDEDVGDDDVYKDSHHRQAITGGTATHYPQNGGHLTDRVVTLGLLSLNDDHSQ